MGPGLAALQWFQQPSAPQQLEEESRAKVDRDHCGGRYPALLISRCVRKCHHAWPWGKRGREWSFFLELDPEVLVRGKGTYIPGMRLQSLNIRIFACRM